MSARVDRILDTLNDTDPVFVELCQQLYGDQVTIDDVRAELVSKLDDPSEVHVNGSSKSSQARAWALRLGVLGAAAGGGLAVKEGVEGARMMAGHVPKPKVPKVRSVRVRGAGKLGWAATAGGADAVAGVLARKEQKQKLQAVPVSKGLGNPALKNMVEGMLHSSRRVTGALMEHTGLNDKLGLRSDVRPPVARGTKTKVDGKKKTADQLTMFDTQGKPAGNPNPGKQAFPSAREQGAQEIGAMAGRGVNRAQAAVTASPQRMVGAGVLGAGAALGVAGHEHKKHGYYQQPAYFSKAEQVDVEFTGRVAKFDEEKRLAFGWASVSKLDGRDIGADRQGDLLAIEDTEVAAYDYNLRSRKGGVMHLRTDGAKVYQDIYEQPGDEPVHVSDLVESMVFTPEKKQALNLPEDFPEGWWVGFRYRESPEGEAAWQKVRKREHPGFSIHGKGIRVPVDA